MALTVWGPDMVLRWFRTIQIGSVLLPIIGCLIWGAIAWRDQRAIATDHAVDTVELVRQYSQRLLETQTVKHRAAQARAATEPEGFLRSESYHRFLTRLDTADPNDYGLAVVALDGTVLASSQQFPASTRFGQRDYIDAIREGAAVFIDRIKLQPGDEDAIIVARPFVTDSFRGLIVSSMATESSRSFLDSITTREGESASLMRDDGKLLVRHEPGEPVWLPEDTPARQSLTRASSGTYEVVAISDGVRRIYAYNRIGDLPLVVNFGVPTEAILTATVLNSLPVWILMLAMGAFTLIASALARRSVEAQMEAELKALKLAEAQSLAQQRAELVREMNHRVKNNLALVTSLINIQARRGSFDPQDLQRRIQALAEVHDLLYRSNHGERIDLGTLLERACDPETLVPEDSRISLQTSLPEGMLIPADRASPLALAALELVTNAVKHAFAGRDQGIIRLVLAETADGQACLTVADDGIGMAQASSRRSGTGLVDAFVRQIDGEMTRTSDHGTTYTIRFTL